MLQQPPGSKSCLPTAITAILRYYECDVEVGEVSDWCQEGHAGCVIDLALEGLRERDYDVEELTEDPENDLLAYLSDIEDPIPILVTVMLSSGNLDHAVVALGIEASEEGKVITYMDPLTGQIANRAAAEFLRCWDSAGSLAFIIRP